MKHPRAQLTYMPTKGNKIRSIPISPDLYNVICKESTYPLLNIAYSMAYRFVVRNVPRLRQQATHALRHTFSFYYMMNDGNIIAQQGILGHGDIKQTMRYAHLPRSPRRCGKKPFANIK
ncbi:tyrosine-type recombinase/integrase [Vibrio cionasavignyae]|uniref:tyrosine-type recombinase/integrase n=1 Tax=Vibrio cionasavignyae TaxID=2910252 RepID=UPI003D12D410